MGPMGGGGMQQGGMPGQGGDGGVMGGQCNMGVGGQSVLANQLIRPGGGMGGVMQQSQQGGYQLRMPQGVQVAGGIRPLVQGGAGRGVMQPQMGAQGSQRMMAMLQQQQQMQQQQQQQQQMLMMQQQGMRPNLGQGGMSQGGMGQGAMGQGGMGQVGMGQVMGQPGMGASLPPDGQDFMDMI